MLRRETINKIQEVNTLNVRMVATPVLWKDHVLGVLLGANNVLFLEWVVDT